ncbi:MAG: MFS transporter [Alphaproteobacteria bacterium]|nr:MFS transporter [Alphaproteobacteria bacterium]
MNDAQRPPVLAPFQTRSFRFQWPADLATSWAQEMEGVILGWYILVETGSVMMLAVFGSVMLVGTLLAPMFGVVGDRIGHRNLLCLMRATYSALAFTLMALIFTGAVSPLWVFVIATLMGSVRSSDLVMRNAIIGNTIPTPLIVGAMSISRTTGDSARIAGALAGAGIVAALGMGPAYLVIALLYMTSFLLTLGVAGSGPSAHSIGEMTGMPMRPSAWRDLGDGLAYVWRTPHLLAAMFIAFLVNLTAYPWSNGLLPYVAREVYRIDQTGLGYLVASFAIGAIIGSIGLSTHGSGIKPARMMIVFSALWHALLFVFALVETEVNGIVVMALAGLCQSLCLVPLAAMLVRTSEPRFRGRVMGVRMLAVYGLPVGLMLTGPLIERFGFTATGLLYSTFGVVATFAIGLIWRRAVWPADAPGNAR